MTLWRLFYHLVWATKGREPLIDDEVRPIVERSLRTTSRQCESSLHAVGLMPDHVHLALSIPPRLAVADVARRRKGASSHAVTAALPDAPVPFAWQAEYGAFSFAERDLPAVRASLHNQPHRHAADRLWPILERSATTEAPP